MRVWIAMVVGMLLVCQAQANLLVNGSFEQGNFTSVDVNNVPVDYVRLLDGSTDITGWTVGTAAGAGGPYGLDWHVLDGPSAHFGPGIDGGHFAVDLSWNFSPAGSISQTFTTTPGANYLLTFLLGSPFFDATVQVSVAGVSQDFSSPGDVQYGFPWRTETLAFTALGTSETLRFDAVAGGFWGPVIDAVSVNQVPAPGTLLLTTAALAVLAARRRKDR